MEGNHTPGPWKVKHSVTKDAFNVVGTIIGCNYKISRCPYTRVSNYPELSERTKKEAEANAKLISMAPTMLSFIEKLIKDDAIGIYSDEAKKIIKQSKL